MIISSSEELRLEDKPQHQVPEKTRSPSTKFQTNSKFQAPNSKQIQNSNKLVLKNPEPETQNPSPITNIKETMKRKNIFKAAIALFVIGFVSAGLSLPVRDQQTSSDYEKAKPAYIVSAADLFDSFRSDREEAEKKYNGQVVMLSGKLDKIEVSENLVTGVFVFDQGMFGDEGIRCTMLPNHSANLKSMPEGSEVQLKGFLTGYNETDIILEQCSVIR